MGKQTKALPIPRSAKGKREAIVAMAKDVIARMKAGSIIARKGTYESFHREALPLIQESVGQDLRAILPKVVTKTKPCAACARGALFLSYVRRFDRCKIQACNLQVDYHGMIYHTEWDDGKYLELLMSNDQISDIEYAFEGWDRISGHASGSTWVRHFPDHQERMLHIMQNLIRNEGVFKIDEVV